MLSYKYSGLLLLCFTFLTHSLLSQIIVQGTVTDNGGEYLGNGAEPVVNALVTITDQTDANRSFSAYTDDQGQYTIEISTTGIEEDRSAHPNGFRLHQNYPNPFNPSTVIMYEIEQPCDVCIEVYNVSGQKVKTILDGFQKHSDQVIWDATDDLGRGVPAGLYIYTMKAEGTRKSRKMLLVDGMYGCIEHVTPLPVVTVYASKSVLYKPAADLFTLEVRGENIATYEEHDLEITGDMIVDVSTPRIIIDIDSNIYRTVKIGDQWWMAENLKTTHYCNGDAINNVTWDMEWSGLTTEAYCDFDNNSIWVAPYGRLYNWYAVTDPRHITPEGWHIPSDTEWQTLEMTLGMSPEQANGREWRGTDEGGQLKETGFADWRSPNAGATNESGFFALGAGVRSDNGTFMHFRGYAMFWTSTKATDYKAWYRWLDNDYAQIYRFYGDFKIGISVRCVRD
jgi:uncharacterized protein (TIGR02145 family)